MLFLFDLFVITSSNFIDGDECRVKLRLILNNEPNRDFYYD